MGFWDKIFGEFIDVIEWIDDSSDTMVYRFPRYGNEIKYGAKLTVREAQVAVFVNEGRMADVFQPGMYALETNNLPVLSTLQNWPHGFQSPFKAEVYFFNTKRFLDLKWGTRNPLMLRDPEFGPVRLRAFGTYAIRIADVTVFLREVVGTDGRFTTNEITGQLRNLIVARFAEILGESGIPILDLAANYDDLSRFITNRISGEFKEYGLEITRLLVENISLPDEVEAALDKRTSMGIVKNLRDYASFQAAEAMTRAAANPGGGAAEGMGIGMGMAMGQQISRNMERHDPPAEPPPLPETAAWYVARDNQQTGPFPLAAIETQIRQGQVTPTTLVWTKGMAEWQQAARVSRLQPLFASTPPPLPDAS